MWLLAPAFGIATVVVAFLAQRGERAQRLVGVLLLAVWVIYVIAQLALGWSVSERIGGALDFLAAVGCTLIWVITGRAWTLLLMGLFMLQLTGHTAFAERAEEMKYDHATARQVYDATTVPMYTMLYVTNAMQIALAYFGPKTGEWVGILRRAMVRRGRTNRGAVNVRKAAS